MTAPPSPTSWRRQVVRLGPHAGAHRVALRASLSLAVPLLLLWASGRMEWSIYAAFGAFVALYGRHDVAAHRWRLQVTLGVMFVAAVVSGTAVGLSDERAWLAVPGATLVAAVGSYASDAQGWHPPGPLFLVFAFGACASIPSTAADLLPALLVSAATAAFAVLVGGAGGWWRGRRGAGVATAPPRSSDWASVARRHVVRCALSCLVAGSAATALSGPLGIGHPYWAMVAAVVPLVARDWSQQVTRGVQRLLGTFGGLLVAAGLLSLHLPVLALIGVVVALQGAAELLIGRNYALALLVVTPLALLMVHLVAPTSVRELLVDRGVETLLGVAVGVGLGWVTRRPVGAPASA
ncbi:FUSC family protein [Nocardioides jishulii]|uniref:FUSC family protein n=1 Tax=Nocardioides jishulii TaxID=2575440 RepID=A0A4U2YGY2_9ACTN|nr:FUSC family protein [Nocardioides jishulii]QCX26744.1 FUSC family protein [Nocardioides jishulii]TKI60286.1 FUSC family protein [Nocardioides jishulii]